MIVGLLGAFVLFLAVLDVVQTTLTLKGGGLLTARLADALWRVSLGLHHRRPSHRLLSYAGPAILIVILTSWTGLMWVGWTLEFLADPDAIVLASSGAPTTPLEVAYFTGYTLITLGNGEYRPDGDVWRFLTVLASTTGFFVVTLAVTFLLSVLPAVVAKRQTALYIASLGTTPEAILARHWDGSSCSALNDHVSTLMSSLGTLAQQHLAYPVLHYYHSPEPRAALALRVAALDEALTLLGGVRPCEDAARRSEPLRDVIGELLASLHETFYDAGEVPPARDPGGLATYGVEIDPDTYRSLLPQREERRQRLLDLARRDGWEWDDLDA